MSKIKLDIDGLIANFEGSATKLHRNTGLGYVPKNFIATTYSFWSEWGISGNKFWSVIDNTPNFWENIEPYPYLDELLAVIPDYRILSTPRPTADCWSGKFKWVQKYLGEDAAKDMILATKKWEIGGGILIDDFEKNVDNWNGDAILFPQEYNRNRGIENKVEFVKKELEMLLSN